MVPVFSIGSGDVGYQVSRSPTVFVRKYHAPVTNSGTGCISCLYDVDLISNDLVATFLLMKPSELIAFGQGHIVTEAHSHTIKGSNGWVNAVGSEICSVLDNYRWSI